MVSLSVFTYSRDDILKVFQAYMRGTLSLYRIFVLLLLAGLLVYSNSLTNNFVFDDLGQIYTGSGVAQLTSGYFRPVPQLIYSLLHQLFSGNPVPYHFLQIIIHILNSLLVFLLFRKDISLGFSLFLSLIFLVHPINNETVVYIANLQDVLFVFFGLLAIHLFRQTSAARVKNVMLVLLLLASLLAKETGLIFLFIILVYTFLFHPGRKLQVTLLLGGVIMIYLLLRLSSGVSFQKDALVPIMSLSLTGRLVHIPAILFYYLQTFLFPLELLSLHSWVIGRPSIPNFVIPLLVVLLCALVSFFLVRKAEKTSQIYRLKMFFLAWFILGLLPHLQIVPVDQTVADHFFYLPLIGLLGFVGIVLSGVRLSMLANKALASFGVVLLLILSVRTAVRNTDWQSQSVLLSRDQARSRDDYLLEHLYATDLFAQSRYDDAMVHIQKALLLYPDGWKSWNILGAIYYRMGDVDKARVAFGKSISLSTYYPAYENLGLLMITHDVPDTALEFVVQANEKLPGSARLWLYRVILENQRGNYDSSLIAARNLYLLQPDETSSAIYSRILRRLPVNIDLH